MSDLISRGELIKELNKYCGNQRYLVSENIREIINNQPTAYDVDKVVEELEKERLIYFLSIANTGDKSLDVTYEKVGQTIDNAIEIVKHGCVDNDVCEWKLTDTKKVMPYKTSCGNEDLYDNNYKYCPYCGKKIKIVGD